MFEGRFEICRLIFEDDEAGRNSGRARVRDHRL
jgi:hypothetical protein